MSNIQLVETIAKGLGTLCPRMVFVGGSVTELYATDPAATEIRPTDDIDCVTELLTYGSYHKLEEELRRLKFANDTESGVICRWKYAGLSVDIMPDDASIMGFSNPWYHQGISNAEIKVLGNGITIKIFTAPFFIASKIVAFNNRGKGNFRTSTDFEDIVYVLDNRNIVMNEISSAPTPVKEFLKIEFEKMAANPGITEGIFCALPYGSTQGRVENVKNTLMQIAQIE